MITAPGIHAIGPQNLQGSRPKDSSEYVKDSDSGIIVSPKLAQRLPPIGNNPEWCSMFVKIQPFYTPMTLLFQLVPLSLAPPLTLPWWGGTFAKREMTDFSPRIAWVPR